MPSDNRRRANPAPEPAAPSRPLRFSIQKHAARRLHYDLRLEHDGVLKSWALPKGPCLDPAEKRLAIEVEDHPLEYLEFEGSIPDGKPGAGTVIVWDGGLWEPEGNAGEALRDGQLKFFLDGAKLRGKWFLVRMKRRPGDEKDHWLLIKERDREVRPLAEYDVLEDRPESALTGWTIEAVAAEGEGASRRARRPRNDARPAPRDAARAGRRPHRASPVEASTLPRAVVAPFPAFFAPQLGRLASVPPEGDQWLHEIKFDGYRLLPFLDRGKVTLRTRKGIDWTERFPELRDAVAALPATQAVLDGEVVALLPNGASRFDELLKTLTARNTGALVFFAFDLLYLDGYDLRRTPLIHRKEALKSLLAAARQGRLQYADHLVGDGPAFFEQCCRTGLEGSMSKRANGTYQTGRTDDWLKVKCIQGGEFVIGGFTDSTSERRQLGAILVGGHNARGELVFAGKVGSGFSEPVLLDLRERLKVREQRGSPFVDLDDRNAERGTHWARPDLVAQIEYAGWSVDGLLWHPRFQGLREDKPAGEVLLERPGDPAQGTQDAAPTPRVKKQRATRPPAPRRQEPKTPCIESTARPAGERSESPLGALERVRFTNPERIVFPDWGLTKMGLATYYAQIADWILPHVVNRPLTIVRCPSGGKKLFYQKHASSAVSDLVRVIMLPHGDEELSHLVIDDLAGLLSLVQISVLELHPWGSRADEPEKPDRVIFDLDPDVSVAWPTTVEAALEVRQRLSDLGLVSFVKTTGGKGLHVVAPLQRRHGWDEVKQFARAIAEQMARDAPARYTALSSKAGRKGKIYVDFLRNGREATAVAAYSTRARPGAPVSTPLSWEELPAIRSDHFHVGNVVPRLAALDRDPWEELWTVRQWLTASVRRKLRM